MDLMLFLYTDTDRSSGKIKIGKLKKTLYTENLVEKNYVILTNLL